MAELEVVRMVADWLATGAAGVGSVNALLSVLPRDASDPQPSLVTVYDSTRHGWAARLTAPRENSGISFPALAVQVRGGVSLDGEVMTTYRDGTADVGIFYVTQAHDTAPALADALYAMRAVLRSLKQFAAPANYDTYRVRNSVAIRSCESIKQGRVDETRDGIVLSTAIIATYHIRDEAP